MNHAIWLQISRVIRRQGENSTIQSFLDAGLDINSHCNWGDGETMLAYAAECGSMEIIRFLVRNGADAHKKDYDGSKPFHIAARFGHMDVIKYFLSIGIDIDSPNTFGETMLHYACKAGNLDTLKYLVETGANIECRCEEGRDVLLDSCYEEVSVEVVKYLIHIGCDPNVQDIYLDTPLHFAVSPWRDDVELVRHLLRNGADLNVKNLKGETPFSVLIRNPLCLDCIAMFLEKGAYLQSNDYDFIIDKPLLKEGILQNVELCTQSVVNKFDFSDLPKVYEIPAFARRLPPIDKMKISNQCTKVQNIAECVNHEINSKGYCNVPNVPSNILYCICVRYLAEFNNN